MLDPTGGSVPPHGLRGVPQTLLTPLYARAHAAELMPRADFRDPLAAELLAATGFTEPEVLGDRGNTLGSLHRVMLFDALTREFTTAHPNAVVVAAGIGLCTRAQRLAGDVPAGVSWIGVDFPEVVDLRRRLLPDEQVRLYAGSVTDPDWARDLVPRGRPALVLAEGVLMYLDPAGLAAFLDATRSAFGPGVELAADHFHPRIALSDRHPIVKATGARFLSGARDGRALAAVTPGWRLVAEHGVMERISVGHRAAALAFRTLSLGGRPYAVAHLRGVA